MSFTSWLARRFTLGSLSRKRRKLRAKLPSVLQLLRRASSIQFRMQETCRKPISETCFLQASCTSGSLRSPTDSYGSLWCPTDPCGSLQCPPDPFSWLARFPCVEPLCFSCLGLRASNRLLTDCYVIYEDILTTLKCASLGKLYGPHECSRAVSGRAFHMRVARWSY